MVLVLIEIVVLFALVLGVLYLLRRVRKDHDDKIVENWRRNGRDRRPWGW